MVESHRVRQVYAIIVFLILLISYSYFLPKWGDWGANSRADLVYAIGDQGVLYIDDYHENTGDKACYPGPYDLETDTCNGHYYTDKSLGPSLVALPFYMVFKTLADLPPIRSFIDSGQMPGNFTETLNPEGRGLLRESVYQGMALTFMTFFVTSLPSAVLGTVVFLFAARFTTRPVYAFVLALAYGLGTIAYPYSTSMVQHQMAAFGAFVGFYLLWRVVYEAASVRWLWLVGVLFGLVAITEYPVVVMLGIIFVWAVYAMPNRLALYRVVVGAVPLGLIFAAYNFAIFSTPLPVGYEYSTLWQDVHDTGFMSFTAPSLLRYYGLTFSPVRGLFLLSPFLLLMLPGVVMMWRQRADQRSVTLAIALAVFAHLTIYASSVMWWGGSTVGPRYLVPMLPFMVIPISFAVNTLFRHGWGIVLTGLLVIVSVLHVWALTIAGNQWQSSGDYAFTFAEMNATLPLTDYAIPMLQAGDVGRNYGGLLLDLNGLAGLIPLILIVIAIGVGLPYVLLRSRPARKMQPEEVKSGAIS